MAAPDDLASLCRALHNDLPTDVPPWPGGYPHDVELALIDAVLSIRARYGQPHNGVRGHVARWREHRGGRADDLVKLASDPDICWVIPARQQLSGRVKPLVIQEAARKFVEAELHTAHDVVTKPATARSAYVGVRGLGCVTYDYFLMLIGGEGVKADTWVTRYVTRVLERQVYSPEARRLLTEAADSMGRSPKQVDHAVWRFMREKSAH